MPHPLAQAGALMLEICVEIWWGLVRSWGLFRSCKVTFEHPYCKIASAGRNLATNVGNILQMCSRFVCTQCLISDLNEFSLTLSWQPSRPSLLSVLILILFCKNLFQLLRFDNMHHKLLNLLLFV
jgi:hypothetical protein